MLVTWRGRGVRSRGGVLRSVTALKVSAASAAATVGSSPSKEAAPAAAAAAPAGSPVPADVASASGEVASMLALVEQSEFGAALLTAAFGNKPARRRKTLTLEQHMVCDVCVCMYVCWARAWPQRLLRIR